MDKKILIGALAVLVFVAIGISHVNAQGCSGGNCSGNTTITVISANSSCPTSTSIISPIDASGASAFVMLCQGLTFSEPFVFGLNDNATLIIPAFNADRSKITTGSTAFVSISKPSGVVSVQDEAMTLETSGFFSFSINDSVNSENGVYMVSVRAQGANADYGFSEFSYLVTPSGAERLTSGQGFVIFAILGLIIVIALIFLFIAFKSESVLPKITFFTLAGIILLIAVFFSILTLSEVASTNTGLIDGFTTFFFVTKVFASLLVTGLFVVVFLIFLKAWKIKRGIIDK